MSDVAKEAGVSRQAIYLHFPSRADLLVATTRHIDEVENVADQLANVFENTTGRKQLTAFVHAWGNYIPVVYGGAKRLLAIKDSDPDAEAAWQDRMTGLHAACSGVVKSLARDNDLADGLRPAEAAHLMWTIVSVPHWEMLRIEQGISQKRYLELTELTLMSALVGDP